MVLQLFGASMRQWFVTTLSRGKRDFVVPWPRKPNPPEVDLYMAADWARGKISLLSFLRKTNKAGKICAWMKKLRHEEGRDHVSLEDFAVEYNMQAEKIVAAQTLSRFNDKFFGQWLMLNVPFKSRQTSMSRWPISSSWFPRSTRTTPWLCCPTTLLRWQCGIVMPPFRLT